jgi:hypothetical protein
MQSLILSSFDIGLKQLSLNKERKHATTLLYGSDYLDSSIYKYTGVNSIVV